MSDLVNFRSFEESVNKSAVESSWLYNDRICPNLVVEPDLT